ncbi:MAG TPA: DHA2 family efflux MFS transporter permease subunit, partial [Solirubrobacterales bacterium]|nr:DHA2 family efflux MFS transporter permease subunit [Solirubrobacterales bacterium]
MIVLDATVVNVALPAIQDDLGFSQSSLAWVVNAYLIAFGGLLLLSGRLGDLISRRDVFLVGLVVFTTASLLCGFAQSDVMLVAFRFLAGIGGALTAAVVLGMIVTMFPEPSEQAKAIGVYAFVASAGGSVGLLAGGILTQALSWHWIFFINIPIGIATGYFSLKLLERDKGLGFSHGADILGAVLITASLMLGVFTIVEPAAVHGWGDTTTLLCSAGSFLLLIAFLVRESTVANPLVPLRIFKSRNVSGANAVQALTVAGMFGLFFLGVLYLQEVLGYDALQTGFAFLPTTLVMGTLSVKFSEPLIMRFGARNCLIVGLVLIAVGLALFARVPVDGNYWTDVLPSTLLLGSGVGVCFPSLMTLAMSGATRTDAGLASGLVNTTAQVGAAIGLAVLATIAANKTAIAIPDGYLEFHDAAIDAAGKSVVAVSPNATYVALIDAAGAAKPQQEAFDINAVYGTHVALKILSPRLTQDPRQV